MIAYRSFDIGNYNENSVIVTDAKLQKLYSIFGRNVFVLPEGEKAKTFDYLRQICVFCQQLGLDKNGAVVAVGGGSVGDIAGFAAGIYKRGIKLIGYPTTLLAMVDSSIGGKTAANLNGVKNQVGVYHKGDVIIDFNFLNTLENCQIKDAWGEIVKYALLSKKTEKAAKRALAANEKYTEELIKLCAEYKYRLTEKHPKDDRTRRKLNMGHTLGHALEIRYNLPHGAAVLNGLYYELALADEIFGLDKDFLEEKLDLICSLTEIKKLDTGELLPLTMQDKKNKDGKICFVLAIGDHKTMEVYLTPQELEKLYDVNSLKT